MTIAVCIKCGATKFGALTVCKKCGRAPETEHEIIYSIALSDHHFEPSTLTEIGKSIASGVTPRLPQQFIKSLQPSASEFIRKNPALFPHLRKGSSSDTATKSTTIHGTKRDKADFSGLCFHCWTLNESVFLPCHECGRLPTKEEEAIYSTALSGRYHDRATLLKMSHDFRSGKSLPRLPPEEIEKLRPAARHLIERLIPLVRDTEKSTPSRDTGTSVPFTPNLPDITKVQPSRAFQAGKYMALFVKDAKSIAENSGQLSTIRYPYTLAVVDTTTQEPVHFVTLETGFFGTKCLCAFDRTGNHRNMGSDPALDDEVVFVQRAITLAQEEFGVKFDELSAQDSSPPPLPPSPPPVPEKNDKAMRGASADDTKDDLVRTLNEMRAEFSDEGMSYNAQMQKFMESHYAYVMSGKGDPENIRKQMAALRKSGFLTDEDIRILETSLCGSEAEDRLRRVASGESSSSVYATTPSSKRWH